MYTGVFVFGAKLFPEHPRGVSSLPLEIAWKIFTYVDDASLRNACFVSCVWKRIILSNNSLRRRLNNFEFVLKLGSDKLAKFHKKNKKTLKKLAAKNYLSIGEREVKWTKKTVIKSKRPGEDIVVCTKRYKLF